MAINKHLNLNPETDSATKTAPVQLILLLLIIAGILAANLRLFTLVTGQDPQVYTVLAKKIFEQNFSLSSVKEVSSSIIPGYPLFMAAAMKVFGIQSIFWLNSFLLIGIFVFLGRILRPALRNDMQTGITQLFCLTVLLSGYQYNPHYLLQAFRTTPELFFILASMAAMSWTDHDTGFRLTWKSALSGILFLFAISIRETSIFIFPVMVLWILFDPGENAAARRYTRIAAFLAPSILLGVVIVLYLLWSGGTLMNEQSHQIMRIFSRRFDWGFFQYSLTESAGYIVEELGIAGLIFFAAGLFTLQKNRRLSHLFLLPAILYFIFYASIKPHRRFFLTAFFFMVPVAGAGLAMLLDKILLFINRDRSLGARRIYQLVLIFLCVWMGLSIWKIKPWGQKVDRGQIATMQALLKSFTRTDDALLVDPRNRYLHEALSVFTDYTSINPSEVTATLIREPPRLFINPLNDATLHQEAHGIPGNQLIRRHARLENTGVSFRLGEGKYEINRVLAWTNRMIAQDIPVQSNYPAVIRIRVPDLSGATDHRTVTTLRIDGNVFPHPLGLGANYFILENPPTGSTHTVTLESDAPLPDDIEIVRQNLWDPIQMDFGEIDVPSYDHYLSPEFFIYPAVDLQSHEVRGAGSVTLPVTYPSNYYVVAMLGARTVLDDNDNEMDMTFSSRNRLLARTSFRANARIIPSFAHLGMQGDAPATNLDLTFNFRKPLGSQPVDERGWNVEVHSLTLYPVPVSSELHINIGSRGDAIFCTDGFWISEKNHSREGRWTKRHASLFIPLQPGPDYLLSITTLPLRPIHAPEEKINLSFNRRPVSYDSSIQNQITARIPADWVTGPSNCLEITSATWRPKDVIRTTADDRQLGVFLDSVDIISDSSIATPQPKL